MVAGAHDPADLSVVFVYRTLAVADLFEPRLDALLVKHAEAIHPGKQRGKRVRKRDEKNQEQRHQQRHMCVPGDSIALVEVEEANLAFLVRHLVPQRLHYNVGGGQRTLRDRATASSLNNVPCEPFPTSLGSSTGLMHCSTYMLRDIINA